MVNIEHGREMLQRLERDGGFTFDPREARFIEIGERDGFAVAIPGTEVPIGDVIRTGDVVAEATATLVVDLLAEWDDHPDAFVGGWWSDQRGIFMVELSDVLAVPRDVAEVVGYLRAQEAVTDMLTGEAIAAGVMPTVDVAALTRGPS